MTDRNDPAKIRHIDYLASLISRNCQMYSACTDCSKNHLDYSTIIDCLQEALDLINLAVSDDTWSFVMAKVENSLKD